MTRNALARTYRPRRFGEMATQEHVSETLRSAVARGRVAHAYLFSGPRGIGKTTAARVLAMALNCPQRGEDGEPCGACDSCQRIWSGKTSLDVVEIDAASNRGVDDARELRERAMYAPTEEGRYKVYIIDEAHMLTREAWNALLKILEEPPPRVIFVFATTEAQKIQQVAPPILSRCQRFDFHRIAVPSIVERLQQVLEREGVETDEQALLLIARRAEGGMRDALSLLDQALSFAEGQLRAEDVQRILGLVADEVYLDLFEIVAEGRVADVFRFVQDVVDRGHDLSEFYRGLADALRTLLVVRFDGQDAADVRDELRDRWADQAQAFSTGDLLRMLGQVAELDADGSFRKSANPRVLLEALLLRFAHLPRTADIEQLIRAVGGDDEALTAPPAAPTPSRRAAPRPGPEPPRTVRGDSGTPPADSAHAGTGRTRDGGAQTADATQPDPSGEADGTADVAEALRAIVSSGSSGLPSGLGPFLRTARIVDDEGDRVTLELPPGPGLERLDEPRARRSLEEALSSRTGRTLKLDVRSAAADTESVRLTPERLKEEQVRKLATEEPAVGRAVEEWDLEMLD